MTDQPANQTPSQPEDTDDHNPTGQADPTATTAEAAAAPPPPPPPFPAPPASGPDPGSRPPFNGLVRDPTTRLGGVASGIAHYYGIDVSLIRILFVLLALSSGTRLLAYLVAWAVIPRAQHWPPAGPTRPVFTTGPQPAA